MKSLMALFSKKSKVEPKETVVTKEAKKQIEVVNVDKIEESKTTLRYDEQVISIEGFRAGMRQGATIKAFRNGNFIPLKDLGEDLLIFDTNRDGYIPLMDSDNEQHQDVKQHVFGG